MPGWQARGRLQHPKDHITCKGCNVSFMCNALLHLIHFLHSDLPFLAHSALMLSSSNPHPIHPLPSTSCSNLAHPSLSYSALNPITDAVFCRGDDVDSLASEQRTARPCSPRLLLRVLQGEGQPAPMRIVQVCVTLPRSLTS